VILLISSSQVAGIMDVSHHTQLPLLFKTEIIKKLKAFPPENKLRSALILNIEGTAPEPQEALLNSIFPKTWWGEGVQGREREGWLSYFLKDIDYTGEIRLGLLKGKIALRTPRCPEEPPVRWDG
jgi:hypothetical protein